MAEQVPFLRPGEKFVIPQKPSGAEAEKPSLELKTGEKMLTRVAPEQAPARSLEEWKKDPKRGMSFGSQTEQKATSLNPIVGRALSGASAFADSFTLGAANWVPAAMAKGAGTIGVPGYERFADKPISEIKKEADRIATRSQEQYPVEGYTGMAGGIGAGMALPAVKGPAALYKYATTPLGKGIISGGLTGVTYGGIEGLAREGDIGQAGESALFGGVTGAAATPILEKVFGSISSLVSRGKPVVDSTTGALAPEAMRMAQEAGLSQEQINYLGPTLVESFKKYGMRPEAVRAAQFQREGISPTMGMVTQDPAQLIIERKMTQEGSPFAAPSYEKIAGEAVLAAGQKAPTAMLPREAAELAGTRIKDVAGLHEGAAQRSFAKSSQATGTFADTSLQNIGTKIFEDLRTDPKNLAWIDDPTVTRALEGLDQKLATTMQTSQGPISHTSMKAVNSVREGLNEIYGSVPPKERYRFKEIIANYDRRIKDAVDQGLYSGPQSDLNDYKKALKLWSTYQKRYGYKAEGPDAGSIVRTMISEKKPIVEIANALFNSDQIMTNGARKIYAQLERAIGKNSPELQNIKNAYINRLMTPSEAGPKGFAKVGKQIDDFLIGNNRDMADVFLSPADKFALQNFGEVMKMASATKGFEDPKQYNLIKSAFEVGSGAIAGFMANQLLMLDPTAATAFAVAGAIPSAYRRFKGTEGRMRAIANRPFSGRGPTPEVPSAATIAPRILPGMLPEEQKEEPLYVTVPVGAQPQRAYGGRVARADGGKVDIERGVRALMMAVDAAKKKVNLSTESLLEQPDEHVAQALSMAKRHI
jgi:hypothetical protein